MTLDDLHKEYGKLMIQQEILQGRIMEIKKRIAKGMNKPKQPNEPPRNPED